MQNTIAAVINLAIIAWLAHLTVEAVRQHKRRTDARRRSWHDWRRHLACGSTNPRCWSRSGSLVFVY